VASRLFSRLPGYTGTNARDIRRALADPEGNLRLYVSLDELEHLLEASLAQYNATAHNGLNGRSPLEAVEHSVRGRGAMLNWLPEAKRRTLVSDAYAAHLHRARLPLPCTPRKR